jgi:hypothetical protein
VLGDYHRKGKRSILFLPMFPASSDKLQQACSACQTTLSDDAAAAIALPLVAAAAGLAGAGYGHCGEQIYPSSNRDMDVGQAYQLAGAGYGHCDE